MVVERWTKQKAGCIHTYIHIYIYIYIEQHIPLWDGPDSSASLQPTRGESACPHAFAWYAPPCSTYHIPGPPGKQRAPNARKQRRGAVILYCETDTWVPVGCFPSGSARLQYATFERGESKRLPTPQGCGQHAMLCTAMSCFGRIDVSKSWAQRAPWVQLLRCNPALICWGKTRRGEGWGGNPPHASARYSMPGLTQGTQMHAMRPWAMPQKAKLQCP